jgi:hypothetical protein
MHRGRHDQVRGLCSELVALGAKLREGSEASFARALCALADYAAGEAPARSVFAQALDDLRAADAKHRLGFVLTQAAGIELRLGRGAAAAAFAEEAVEVAMSLGRPSDMALAHAMAARAAAAAGNDAAELGHLGELRRMRIENLSHQARQAAAALTVASGRSEAGQPRDGAA